MLDDLPLDLPVPFRGPDGRELDLNALLTPHPIATFYMGTPEKARSTAAQLVSAMESR